MRLCALASIAFLLAIQITVAGAVGVAPPNPRPFRSGAVIVKFKPGIKSDALAARVAARGGVVNKEIKNIGLHRVGVAPGRELETIRDLRKDPSVLYAEPDYQVSINWAPDDPDYGRQWGLPQIGAGAAWDWAKGTGAIVAVVDTGADLSHPDLAPNLVPGYDFVNDTATPQDDNGHGTHVSGIIAAVGDNLLGGIGIAPLAKVMPIKALNYKGLGYYSDIVQGIEYAADHGAQVISMSFGGSSDAQSLHDAIDYAWNKGVLLVAAAGNSNISSPFYPAAYSNVMAVAATDSHDLKASFSNFGSYVDVAAPGVSILSTIPGGYQSFSGTSMATPFVAGVAALALSNTGCPGMTNLSIRHAIENGADNINASNPSYVGQLGHGRINAYHSLATGQPLSVASNSMLVIAQAGDPNQQQRTIAVNTGSCTAPWSAAAVAASAASGWLTVSAGGPATHAITVSTNAAHLSPGTYSANVSVGYTAPGSAQQTIAVTMIVAPHVFQADLSEIRRNAP